MSNLADSIWVEKYRPKALPELLLEKETRKKFAEFLRKKELPNLLFHGSYGTGKTTLALILCRRIASEYIELNASDDRSVAIVRDKVKSFSYHKALGVKIILLDECDDMMAEAQRVLKRVIEKSSCNSRFILTANSTNRIIPAIRSRMQVFNFKPVPKEFVVTHLLNILTQENVEHDIDDVARLVEKFHPDIRQCVNTLQFSVVTENGDRHFKYNEDIGSTSISMKMLMSFVVTKDLTQLRQYIVDNPPNYDTIYRELLDAVLETKRFKDSQSDAAFAIIEAAYRDGVVVDRELSFIGCCFQLASLL